MKLTTTIALLACALLSACGGGDESDERREVAAVSVPADIYVYPLQVGIQDRVFDSVSFTNTSGRAVTVEVAVSGSRTIITSDGLSGAAWFTSFVSVVDQGAGLLVPTAQDSMPRQITGLAPGTSSAFVESTRFTIEVPAGKTYVFTPHGRVMLPLGSVGKSRLETANYRASISA